MNMTDACPPALLGPERAPKSVLLRAHPLLPSPRTEKHKVVGKIRYREAIVCFGATLRLPIVGKSEASDTDYLQTWGHLSGNVRKGGCAKRRVTYHRKSRPKYQHVERDDFAGLELHTLRHDAFDGIKGQSHVRAMQTFQVPRVHNEALASRCCMYNDDRVKDKMRCEETAARN